jgi:ribonuclease BN (tRNA processing enzyme)
MDGFALKCFGIGDGWACPDRNHSSFLYRFGKTSILIDCGEPLSSRYKASGLSYDLIDRIFLSHLHFDHVGGLFMLLQGFWLERRSKALPIHMPAHGIDPVRKLLQAGCIFDELFDFDLHFTPLRVGESVEQDTLRVIPFATSHLESLRLKFEHKYPNTFEAFSFLLEWGDLRIAHSADIGQPEDLAPLVRNPVDLLVCEMAHFKPEALFRFLRGKPVKRILFIHLARPYWENLEETRALAAQMLPGIPFSFARDGEEIS